MNPDQIRSHLQGMLPSVGQQGRLTISRSTFNDDGISHLLDICYNGSAIVIDEAVLLPFDATSNQTVVTGTASFLNVAQMPITATFRGSASGIDIVLRYQLPATWKFSQSFPSLPATWMPSSEFASMLTTTPTILNPDLLFTSSTTTSSGRSLLDLLTFTAASFIVTTSPIVDQAMLATGLNFLCHLQLNGLLGVIETELQCPDPLVLAGSIVLPTALP
ncbi:MAG TPA: hypothetical protein VFN35_28050, partial [Ktedonobacteraceae bacterium]|nr:hypothetical protein [Ktedonobacteraceae bacterium]